MPPTPRPHTGAVPSPEREVTEAGDPETARREDVDRVFRDAVAIRHLLGSLDEDDHAMRSRLLLARDEVRLRAARLWSERGWRPIGDSH